VLTLDANDGGCYGRKLLKLDHIIKFQDHSFLFEAARGHLVDLAESFRQYLLRPLFARGT